MYKVLARKWRPARFDELVGQPHVARALSNAIAGERVAHAYLLAGVRGTGKTTVARIFAKCLNCEKGPTVTPCGECAACTEIAESRALDVLEVDAASRTKVDQTRELLEMVSYAPVRDRYKVLIIDEVHMLSRHSFNALLKTLEEPRPNVVFVLATTEMQSVPPTILSRCQVFEFRRVGFAEVAAHLRKIADSEGITISPAAVERLARAGEGSIRDSISALERVLAFCGETISDDDVLRMLGAVRAEVLNEIVAAMAARDAGAMLTVLDRIVDEGHDLVHFWSELVTVVRDVLVQRTLPGRPELLSRPAEEATQLAAAAEGLSREDLSRIFRILAELETGLRSSSLPQFLFEAALVRLASLGAVRPIEELLEAAAAGAKPAPAPARAVAPRPPAPAAPQKKKAADARDLVNRLHDERPLLAAVLDQARSVHLAEGTLRIGLDPGMEALKKRIEDPASLALLRELAAAPDGRLEIHVEVGAAPPARAQAAGRPLPESLLERMRGEPAVGKLLDAFGAQVVDVRPLGAAEPAEEP